MKDPKIIWLEPSCDECENARNRYDDGRTWCQDNVYDPCEYCGRQATKYVIAPDQLPNAAD